VGDAQYAGSWSASRPRGVPTDEPSPLSAVPVARNCTDAEMKRARRVGIPTTILTPNVSLSDPLPWERFQQADSGV
jgi:hypothetical protein